MHEPSLQERFSPISACFGCGPAKLLTPVVKAGATRVHIEATLSALGQVCATCQGTFVAVKPSHPAYHRW